MRGTMTSHSNNDDTEGDLYESSSDNEIKYETLEVPEPSESDTKRNGKFRGSVWSLPPAGFSLYRRTFNDRFADVLESIGSFIKKRVDFLRVFVYNLYCKIKHHERINTVKKTDTKSTVTNTKSNENTKHWYNINWGACGRGIIGLGLFLLVASEILATAIVFIGTENEIVPKVIVAPIAIHAFITLVKVFVTFTTKGDK